MIMADTLAERLYKSMDGVEWVYGIFTGIIHYRMDGRGRELIVPITDPTRFQDAYQWGMALAASSRLTNVVIYCDVAVGR